jgi:sterol desaturase/sphingolipid hydroxylase (fatty acid hydroxylase superfamily)
LSLTNCRVCPCADVELRLRCFLLTMAFHFRGSSRFVLLLVLALFPSLNVARRFQPLPLHSIEELITFFKESYFNSTIAKNSADVQLRWDSMEAFWVSLHQKYQPFFIWVAFYVTVVVVYFIVGLFLIVVEQRGWLAKYKIQPTKLNTPENYWLCMKNILTNYFCVILPLGLVLFPFTAVLGIRYDDPFPSWSTVFFHLALFMFLEDFFQYWQHRFLHLPFIYQHIHKVHHQFNSPFGFSASYAHWAEVLFLGMAAFLPTFIVGPHLFTFYCWIQLRQFDAIITHCGFDLPFNPLHILPFYGGTRFHDYHHVSWYYNYASRFTILDKMFGTFKEPPETTTETSRALKQQ